jgi:hypothetical protein
MTRYGGAAALLLALVTGCGHRVDPLVAATGQRHAVLLEGHGLVLGVVREGPDRVCFDYVGTRQGGGHCMVNTGWAVEAAVADAGPTQVLMVIADPRAAEVRVPRTDGTVLTVVPRRVAAVDAYVAAVAVDLATLRLGKNAVAAYDAAGRLLGRTHDCDPGAGGRPDCGPYDGPMDRATERAVESHPY